MRYDRNEVLARVDLAELADALLGPRHPRTRSWSCPNPDHAQTGRTPPVSVFADRRGGKRWHCHGCGDGGTAIDLTLRAGQAEDFKQALEWLAHRAHVSPAADPRPAPRLPDHPPAQRGPDAAARRALDAYAHGCAEHLRTPAGLEVRRWLTETRAIPQWVLDHAGVGADPGIWRLPRLDGIPRISPAAVFPIMDDNGQMVFTVSRAVRPIGTLPRWVNTASTLAPNPRLAVFQPPRPDLSGPIVATEGVLDALSVVSAGRPAAAVLGTGVIDDAVADRLAKLGRLVLIATDNDASGRLARDRLHTGLAVRGVATADLQIPDRFNDLNDWHVASQSNWPSTLVATLRLSRPAIDAGVASPGLA